MTTTANNCTKFCEYKIQHSPQRPEPLWLLCVTNAPCFTLKSPQSTGSLHSGPHVVSNATVWAIATVCVKIYIKNIPSYVNCVNKHRPIKKTLCEIILVMHGAPTKGHRTKGHRQKSTERNVNIELMEGSVC